MNSLMENLFGHRRRAAHQQFGDRQGIDLVDVDRLAMVLGNPHAAKSQVIGEDNPSQVLVIGLRGAGDRVKTVLKMAELHGKSFRCGGE